MMLPGYAPPGRAPAAASPIALAAPPGPANPAQGGEPRGALILVEIEIYTGAAPQP